MTSVRARRHGSAWEGLLPAVGHSSVRLLTVVGLIVGVVAMHSLSLGHGPMSDGHPMSVGMAQMTGMGAPSAPYAAPARQATTPVTADVEAVSGVDTAHGMAAMCLAVLPFLGLLLARAWGFLVRGLGSMARLVVARGSVLSGRAPPAYRRPSLLKLCILRT